MVGAIASRMLIGLIALITNFAFYQRFSLAEAVPADAAAHLGLWIIPIPIVGGADCGFHGALRLESDSRARHSGGDGAGPHESESHSGADYVFETGVGGSCDRHGRTVRRKEPIIATGGRWGRWSGRSFTARRQSGRRCWRPVRRPAWRRCSAVRCLPCCWRLNCCCSSFGRVRSFPSRWRR